MMAAVTGHQSGIETCLSNPNSSHGESFMLNPKFGLMTAVILWSGISFASFAAAMPVGDLAVTRADVSASLERVAYVCGPRCRGRQIYYLAPVYSPPIAYSWRQYGYPAWYGAWPAWYGQPGWGYG